MLIDIILLYILYTIKAPIWCYVLLGIRFTLNLIMAGVKLGKSK